MSFLENINEVTSRTLTIWIKYSDGYAPKIVSEILSKSRLDRVISLTNCLEIWLSKSELTEGELILANANLGALVESWLKFFYVIHLNGTIEDSTYIFFNKKETKEAYEKLLIDNDSILTEEVIAFREENLIPPNNLTFDQLKQFAKKSIFDTEMINWISSIQSKRNAIHSFNEKEIGTYQDYQMDIFLYLEFLNNLCARLPDIEIPNYLDW